MSVTISAAAPTLEEQPVYKEVPRWLTLLLAITVGLVVANNYYAQPLAGPISASLGMSPAAAGLIVTLTQIGYAVGLMFIVPLGDLLENRRLVITLIGVVIVGLLGIGLSTHPAPFLASAMLTGLGSVAVQVLFPYAAHLAPPASRGRIVGNVMSGLMLGIMLARPASSFIAHLSSWHLVFFLSAGAMLALSIVLGLSLPVRVPHSRLSYGDLLGSMVHLMLTTPILRRRAMYQAAMFGAFSLFWTTVPLLLAGPVYRMSQGGIALFALAGVAGAISAPIAGRVADRGWTRPATLVALLCGATSFAMTHFLNHGSTFSLGVLVASGVVLDFGVSANLTLGQRAIFVLGDEYRARLNGLYMTTFFVGGAICSAVGGWTFAFGGWPLVSSVGFSLVAGTLVYFATER